MENQESFEKVVKKVKSIDGPEKKMRRVYEKYKDMFNAENIMNLDVEKFLHFFSISENEHWGGLLKIYAHW